MAIKGDSARFVRSVEIYLIAYMFPSDYNRLQTMAHGSASKLQWKLAMHSMRLFVFQTFMLFLLHLGSIEMSSRISSCWQR